MYKFLFLFSVAGKCKDVCVWLRLGKQTNKQGTNNNKNNRQRGVDNKVFSFLFRFPELRLPPRLNNHKTTAPCVFFFFFSFCLFAETVVVVETRTLLERKASWKHGRPLSVIRQSCNRLWSARESFSENSRTLVSWPLAPWSKERERGRIRFLFSFPFFLGPVNHVHGRTLLALTEGGGDVVVCCTVRVRGGDSAHPH